MSEQDILIEVQDLSITARLNRSETARKILDLLPLESRVNVWGREIYFDIPLQAELEPDAREEVEVGELGYWPSGPAFCIFFGPTPVSTGAKPRAYSPVNVVGKITGDVSGLEKVPAGAAIRVSRA